MTPTHISTGSLTEPTTPRRYSLISRTYICPTSNDNSLRYPFCSMASIPSPGPACVSNQHLISMFIECTLHGIFLTLFISSTWLLTLRLGILKTRSLHVEKRERMSLAIYLCLGIMMFLCITGVSFSDFRCQVPVIDY